MPFISFSRSCCGKSAQKKEESQRRMQLNNKIEQNEFKQELLETKMELLDERNPQDGKKLLVIKLEIAKIRTENQKLRSAAAEMQT